MWYNEGMDTKIRDLPDDLHKDLKRLCVEEEISMNKKILQLITREVEKFRKARSFKN